MPEGPEVQVQVDGLRQLIGNTFQSITVHPASVAYHRKISKKNLNSLIGCTITKVERLGKHIIFEIRTEDFKFFYLLVHLAMTGGFLINKSHPNERVKFKLSEYDLCFRDIRKFGSIQFHTAESLANLFRNKLGLDMLNSDELTIENYFLKTISGKLLDMTIYELLLDQSFVSGLGNIYVNEILWRAKTHPMKKVGGLGISGVRTISLVTPKVLNEAYRLGGSSIKDFTDVNGNLGKAQTIHQVYGRDKCYCASCNKKDIESIILRRKMENGRTAFFCPKCQT